ncbi:MAG: inorganic diphosphatase, partial [Clostridia bacterium]|nr:inorganic diphosphatase [Clostridia bacterium]
ELPSHIYEEMKHFFMVYKELEGKETAVNEVSGHNEAEGIIAHAIDGYIENYCK